MRQVKYTLLAALLALTSLANAGTKGAHVHGAAHLHVIVEGSMLQLELIAPLESLLGFEHMPQNARQRSAVESMREKFRRPEALFVPSPAAGCKAGPAELVSPVLSASEAAAHKKDADGHTDLEAVVVFQCASPDALNSLELRLFEAFPRLHRLQLQMVGPKGQAAATLTPKRRIYTW